MKVVAAVALFFLSSASPLCSSLFPTNNSPALSQTVFLFPSLYTILPEQIFSLLSLISPPVFIGGQGRGSSFFLVMVAWAYEYGFCRVCASGGKREGRKKHIFFLKKQIFFRMVRIPMMLWIVR